MSIIEEIQEGMEQWLVLDDSDTVAVVVAAVIANRLSGDPVWLMVLGPSGSGKSEIIQPTTALHNTIPISSLTVNTIASGWTVGPRSGILDGMNQGETYLWTFKDFTSLASIAYEARREIMGQLREVYDGAYVKHFGNGKSVNWKGKVSLIAGSTSEYDRSIAIFGSLGERFITWKHRPGDAEAVALRSYENTYKVLEMREFMRGLYRKLDEITLYEPHFSNTDVSRLARLCVGISRLRAAVPRNEHGIIDYPEPEAAGRLGHQIPQLLKGLVVGFGHDDMTPVEQDIIERLAVSCVPRLRQEILMAIGHDLGFKEIVQRTNLPKWTVQRQIEDLSVLDVIHKSGDNRYELNDEIAPFVALIDKKLKESKQY